jgi:CheY-like chemotaxis protein
MKSSTPDTTHRASSQEGDLVDHGDTAAASCPPNSRITSASRPSSKGYRSRLALACPDGAIRQILSPLFESIGNLTVSEVVDGTQLDGLLTNEGPFDLIISHANLPGSRGLEVLTKARERGDATPFILVQSLHQNFVRITIGGGPHSIVSTRLVNVVALTDLVRQLLSKPSSAQP